MRATITTTTAKLIENTSPAREDTAARSFVVLSPTSSGVVLLKRGPAAGPAPTMTDAARWDFSKLVLEYSCEPGQALYAATVSGTVDLDVLEGGER